MKSEITGAIYENLSSYISLGDIEVVALRLITVLPSGLILATSPLTSIQKKLLINFDHFKQLHSYNITL